MYKELAPTTVEPTHLHSSGQAKHRGHRAELVFQRNPEGCLLSFKTLVLCLKTQLMVGGLFTRRRATC